MKRILSLCVIAMLSVSLFAQGNIKWKTAFGSKKVFIENKSQFDGKNNLAGTAILFGTESGNAQIFFTKNGLTYSLTKTTPKFNKEKEEKERSGKNYAEREKEEHEVIVTRDMVQMQWENANPNVKVVGIEIAAGYQNYVVGGKNVSHVANFKKLVYQNLYPGIDVEYTFPEKEGIEYSFIIHPGADASQIKMKYSDVSKVFSDEKGNVHLPTKFGDIIDHAPSTYYANHQELAITSRFIKTGKTVSFDLGNYDKTKTVVIDPWTVTPSLPSLNTAFYIKSDSAGNAYVYGGDSPFALEKYNSAGALQWTYNSPWVGGSSSWFGVLAVDRAGNSYITDGDGGTLAKIDTGGHVVWSHNSSSGPAVALEYWAMDFNCDQSQLFVGGTRDVPLSFGFWGTVFKMNMSDGTISSYYNISHSAFNVPPAFNEVRSMCNAPNGNLYYLTLDSIGSISQTLTNNTGRKSTYSFPYYMPYSNQGGGQGQNNMRANAQFIYTTDGLAVHKRDINTGNILDSVAIPGGSQYNNSGIAIDSCGNVYVGSQRAVVKYDANLNYIMSDTTPAAVYDVSIGANGDVFACGNDFAVAFAMSACNQMIPICLTVLTANATQQNPLCAGQCTGTATATATSGTGPYTYAWTGGQTTRTATNLCPGNYTVTITDASSNATGFASVVIAQPGAFTATIADSATTCGTNNGSAKVTVTSGTGPYTYLWSNNATAQTVNNLPAGQYICTVSGAGGCSDTVTAVIDTSSVLALTAYGGRVGCTSSGTATVNISTGTGPFTYSWSNGGTASSINSLSAGAYSVTVTGAGGCSASTTVTVISTGTGVTLSSSANPATCGTTTGSASVNAITGNAPFTYSWSNGGTDSSITNVGSGSYVVTVTANGGCSATASAQVTSTGTLSVTTSALGTTCGNSNGSASVNAGTGSFTYSWSNNATTDTITNVAAGTYTVSVQGSPGCSATASATVNPSGGAITISAPSNAVCQGDTEQVCAPAGYQTYHWNTGAGTQCVNASAAGSFNVTVTDNANCTANSNQITITVNVPDTVSITQRGDSLVAGAASTYQWYFNGALIAGATSSVYIPTQDGNYYVVTTDQNGCSYKTRTEVVKGILGINELIAGSIVKVYPNPLANGNWHLDVSTDWIGSTCEIYDAAGRLVFKTEVKATQSEFELNVAQGIYMMRISSAQKNHAVKLIKL